MTSDPVQVIEIRTPRYASIDILAKYPTDVAIVEVYTRGPSGPPGVQGEEGDQGEQGEQGAAGPPGAEFSQTFVSPIYQWVIVHNLDAYPVVTTVDTNGEEIIGDVTHPDRNTVIVNWLVPFAGTARLKA